MNYERHVKPKMSERAMFSGYPASTKVFYRRIFYLMTLNLAAVKLGLFDEVLCETEDPFAWLRFTAAIPELKARLIITKNPTPPESV